ncbi:J domain-containing protein [Priestia megaterium]|uniref:J domain-containing protein n=1 Tax=Priestia megaterium TaxID=1404 RepID=UPI0011A60DFE|nr:J domain-containing protein [Priestia megaterium]
MGSLFLFLAIMYVGYKVFSFFASLGEDSTNQMNNEPPTHVTIHPVANFMEGFYAEDCDVYIKGPVFLYSGEEEGEEPFYAYGEGTLLFRNSTGNVHIQLKKLNDGRIVPVKFCINGTLFPVIDKNGVFLPLENGNYNFVSIARTFCFMLQEQSNKGVNHNLQQENYLFLRNLIVFNMLGKRSMITNYSNDHITIPYKDVEIFDQKCVEFTEMAHKTIWSYENSFSKQHQNQKIAELLKILELPTDTKSLDVIKKQYRKLAQKYHPDKGYSSDEKIKQIIAAYEELCEQLKAS